MKTGDKVNTPFGEGEVLTQEYSKGALSERYLIKLESCPDRLLQLQSDNGGIYFWGKEISNEHI